MKNPPGKQPFFVKDGLGYPLFISPRLVEEARAMWPKLWIEPTPLIPS